MCPPIRFKSHLLRLVIQHAVRAAPAAWPMLAAMRRASSRVSSLPVASRPGSSSQYTKASACPLWLRTMKQDAVSSDGPGRREAARAVGLFIAGLN